MYASGGLADLRLGWFDRQGNRTGTIDAISHMDIALDNTRVAADRYDAQSTWRDIWVFDERRGTRARLTFSPQNDWVPKWSPDGTRIAFTSDRETPDIGQIYIRAADGSGNDELLLKTDEHKHHLDWSRDGKLMVFESEGNRSGTDLWLLPLDGSREPKPLLQGPFNESQPGLSPDGRYIGYTSNESGVYEVYVQAMPPGTGRWQISTSGGVQPLWRGDSREMYYLAADGRIMALDVDLKTPSFGVPKALFQSAVIGDSTTEHVSVTTDGQRFLMQDSASAARAGFTVVLNWLADLRK